MVLADFASYMDCHANLVKTYADYDRWTKLSILNVAHMGKFSSDRTIQQYSDEIWHAKPVSVPLHRY